MKGKIRYDKDVDIATVILSDKKLAYETELDDVIVGFSEDNEPIWLEILNVSSGFLPQLNRMVKHAMSAEASAV
ncbi:MAG: hypothetical protein BA870_03715 [Desulfuromonadales bacterium C00003094]|jgi:predicted nucleotidyltransferase|nr:MAG: hypothetical protein BA870_03715 [Desulfuromonadales bacterium C00003094]